MGGRERKGVIEEEGVGERVHCLHMTFLPEASHQPFSSNRFVSRLAVPERSAAAERDVFQE